MDMSQFSAEFQAFINQFATKKGNDLQFSNAFMPKRVETYVIDLSTARDSGAPLEIKVPFNAVHVESIYTTSSGAAATGTVKISFDYGDIASIANCKTLSSNDSFTVDKEVSKAFITNTAQSGISARIAFMTDIDYRPGATQSVITSGNVAITNTSAAAIPVRPRIASATIIDGFWGNQAVTLTYTVPANKYAIVTIGMFGTSTSCYASLGSANTRYLFSGAGVRGGTVTLKTGESLWLAGGAAEGGAYRVEEYDV